MIFRIIVLGQPLRQVRSVTHVGSTGRLRPDNTHTEHGGQKKVAPEVGFEPTTNRLTADRSTTELLRSVVGQDLNPDRG